MVSLEFVVSCLMIQSNVSKLIWPMPILSLSLPLSISLPPPSRPRIYEEPNFRNPCSVLIFSFLITKSMHSIISQYLATHSLISYSVPFSQQINPSWHWVEKNCFPWSNDYLTSKLTGLEIQDGNFSTQVDSVKVSGDSHLNQRKGKILTIFDLCITMEWTGKVNSSFGVSKMKKPSPNLCLIFSLVVVGHENFRIQVIGRRGVNSNLRIPCHWRVWAWPNTIRNTGTM